MKLEAKKNKGKIIFEGARISNGEMIFNETLNTSLLITTIGIHSIDEFKDSTYCYLDGEFENIVSKEQVDILGSGYTFAMLRNVQYFVDTLWDIKDNNVYVRDGFLICYSNEFEDGFTYKASLSEVFTFSSGERGFSTFTDEELKRASDKFETIEIDRYKEDEFFGKYPSAKHFYKSQGSTRIERAAYFIKAARANIILPMKIVSYCTALECLFTIGTSEINHKIAVRVAILLGMNSVEKKEIYNTIKEAYKYRSLMVHGQHLKTDDEYLSSLCINLDSYLRDMLNKDTSIFEAADTQMEEFFIDSMFK